jgi:hypothetical protein
MLILCKLFRNIKSIHNNENTLNAQNYIEYELLDKIIKKQDNDILLMIENINRNNNKFIQEFTYKLPNINLDNIKK